MHTTAQAQQPLAPSLAGRGLRPASELAKDRPHGDRIRYMAGCRCAQCRGANTEYERGRAAARKAGDWNGLVPADRARAHLAVLSLQSVGRRTVGDVSGVADSVLVEIIAGRKTTIRARTERAILAVTTQAAADRALVPAKPTWTLIDRLLADGFSKAELARRLGYARPALQFNRRQVTVRSAFEVSRLYEQLRSCDARGTLSLLEELSTEGFRRERIVKQLCVLAQEEGEAAPDLTVRKGRIRQSTARLVRKLHEKLTA